jgi:hypothetical protein
MGGNSSTGTIDDMYRTYHEMPPDIANFVKDKIVTFKCVTSLSKDHPTYLYKSIEPVDYQEGKYYICCLVTNNDIDGYELHKNCKNSHLKNKGQTFKDMEICVCPNDLLYLPKTQSVKVSDGFDIGIHMDNSVNIKFNMIYSYNPNAQDSENDSGSQNLENDSSDSD